MTGKKKVLLGVVCVCAALAALFLMSGEKRTTRSTSSVTGREIPAPDEVANTSPPAETQEPQATRSESSESAGKAVAATAAKPETSVTTQGGNSTPTAPETRFQEGFEWKEQVPSATPSSAGGSVTSGQIREQRTVNASEILRPYSYQGSTDGAVFYGNPVDGRARGVRSSSNLKQTGLAFGMYQQDYADLFAGEGVVEVVVIAKDDDNGEWMIEDAPGTGGLLVRLPKEKKTVPVPLKHTDVKATISGYIATVDVTQQYTNPFSEKIEAVYVFPLPQNAAVSDFLMTIGDRTIRGIIREREEAERIYEAAKAQGYVASLLTQERPNIFTQKIANIEPGKDIDINIKYFNTLSYLDGWYEFSFPMVVGPRFNPPGSTDGVGAVARDAVGVSGQATEVQYMRPDERSGHDIALSVEVDAGVAIESVECRSHVVKKVSDSPSKMTVSLGEFDTIPNKDFVLRYKVAGDRVKTALLTHEDERGGFFTLMLYPPEKLESLKRKGVELVFVLDCSGSMRGEPIAQAKAAVERALRLMEPGDSFQIIRFSNNASQLGRAPIEATAANVEKGIAYVKSLEGGGGTMMIEGIKAALDFPHDPKRLRFVTFLTDGYIGNEGEILAAVKDKIGASRIFSFGVGSSVNRYLLDSMADIGRGTVAYLGLRDSAADVMDAFFARVSHPALTDIEIDWGGATVTDVYPSEIPDLFVGSPVILTGRYLGRATHDILVNAKIVDEKRTVEPGARLTGGGAGHEGLAKVWARMKIDQLSKNAISAPGSEFAEMITDLALEYGLMSQYTAFVAVDSLTQTAGDHGTTVVVPVPVPEGVRYDTTVTEKQKASVTH